MLRVTLATPVFFLLSIASAHAEGDPTMGKRQFAPCSACHTTAAGEPDKVGPNLHGIFGKPAASKADFAYSDALKKSAIVWNEQTIDTWITKPAALVPGTKMAFIGIANDEVRANIIAYLKDATK